MARAQRAAVSKEHCRLRREFGGRREEGSQKRFREFTSASGETTPNTSALRDFRNDSHAPERSTEAPMLLTLWVEIKRGLVGERHW